MTYHMKQIISRRRFMQSGCVISVASAVSGVTLLSAVPDVLAQTPQTNRIPDRGPRLSPEMVNEFVIAGHGNLNKVQKLLAQEPKLVNATWDWGGGDWETALGDASHMGHKEIARYLLEKGARMDLFAAAMLGKLDLVKAPIEAFPGIRNTAGPHGITLLAHAKAGGVEASAVVKYLES